MVPPGGNWGLRRKRCGVVGHVIIRMPCGRYYPYENTDTLIDSLLRAWTVHGSSTEIYVDNGKVYHSKALTVACAQLQIRKLHRPPREPQPGGLIERFFQTVQSQFESEVRACRTITLTELNEHFSNWLKVDYHQTAHSSDTRQRGAHQQQPTLPPPQKLEESAYFRALQAEAEKQQQSERQDGINFHSAMAHGRLTLTGLCQCVARLLGHKGGLSEFTAEELHALQRLHQDHPHVLQSHVRTAFERVTSADFTSVLWELQQLLADMKGTD